MREHPDTDFFTPALPRVFGHRGAAGTHPENTLESFRAAAASGVQYLEFDIRMTRDGEIVVAHDDHLKRMCGLDRAIPEMTYAELANADAGRMFTLDGATFPFREKEIRVPRLSEVIAEFPKLRMIVEVKQIAPSVVAPMLGCCRSRRDAPQRPRRQRASAAARRSAQAGAENPDQLFVSRIGNVHPGDGHARLEL